MARTEKGFTLVEMAMVVTILGIAALMAMPRIERGLARQDLSSARAGLVSVIQRARIAAIQQRRPVTVTVDSAVAVVTAQDPSGSRTVAVLQFRSQFGVAANPSASSITFQPTGLALGGTPLTIRLARAGLVDSVKLVGYGRIE